MRTMIEPQIALTEKVMNMQLQRQNVVMSNVANIKTPGYKPMVLEFEDRLQEALGLDTKGLSRTNPRHLPTGFNPEGFSAEWEKELKPRVVWGEDRVNLDKEMTVMAKTSLQYNALTTAMKSSFDGLRNVIMEGAK